MLDKLADVLKPFPNPIRVEGHTDDRPIKHRGISVQLGIVRGAGGERRARVHQGRRRSACGSRLSASVSFIRANPMIHAEGATPIGGLRSWFSERLTGNGTITVRSSAPIPARRSRPALQLRMRAMRYESAIMACTAVGFGKTVLVKGHANEVAAATGAGSPAGSDAEPADAPAGTTARTRRRANEGDHS